MGGTHAHPDLAHAGLAQFHPTAHVPVSLMPAGLTLGLKPQESADLLAYLETLTGK